MKMGHIKLLLNEDVKDFILSMRTLTNDIKNNFSTKETAQNKKNYKKFPFNMPNDVL